MGLQGGHVIPVALVLKQDGDDAHRHDLDADAAHRDRRWTSRSRATIADGAFTLSGTVEGAKDPTTIEITGKLNDDGMLEGASMSGTQGRTATCRTPRNG